jgi:hypothetical protein
MKLNYLTLLVAIGLLCNCQKNEESVVNEEIINSIEEFENRKIYTELDENTIKRLSDEELEQTVIDYIDHKIGDNYEEEYNIVTGLSKGFQAIYTTWWVEAEVNNGGFHQYFWNPSGKFADLAVVGFKEIGAIENAELMEKAIAIVIREFPEMKKFHDKGSPEAFSESYKYTKLNDLDDKFYEYKEDLSGLRIKYIRENIQLFITN